MIVKSEVDFKGMREAGRAVALALAEMGQAVRAGMTTRELDEVGAKALAQLGARSAPILTYDFPGTNCISLNDEVAHGIPGERVIQEGDIVKIDCSAEKGGYYADAAITVAVPPVTERAKLLIDATRLALEHAVREARVGDTLKIFYLLTAQVAEKHALFVIEDMPLGHGIGKALHEKPMPLPSSPRHRTPLKLKEGMVLAIEPYLCETDTQVVGGADGWLLQSIDGGWSAQFEHTIVMVDGCPVVVTLP